LDGNVPKWRLHAVRFRGWTVILTTLAKATTTPADKDTVAMESGLTMTRLSDALRNFKCLAAVDVNTFIANIADALAIGAAHAAIDPRGEVMIVFRKTENTRRPFDDAELAHVREYQLWSDRLRELDSRQLATKVIQ
jgi:hypothetical protein